MARHDDLPAPLAETAPAGPSDSLRLGAAAALTECSSSDQLRLGPRPGELVADRFLIEHLADAGGMGTIYRGVDLRTREVVAIKVMNHARFDDSERFAREAAVLAELSHPAIVRYIAHGTTLQAAPFLAMEWLEGENLADRLLRSPLTVEQSLQLLRRTCAGVAAAHARGVVHRDLKPSNLFLVDCDPTSLKVLDFGIAQQTDAARRLTQSGLVLGTVGYMAPEQAWGARDLDTRADVFALGCVLFECITGRAAFVGTNAVAVLAKVLSEEPPAASELRPGVAAAVDSLLARMLDKKPSGRPKDAAEVLHVIDELGQTTVSGACDAARIVGLTRAEQKIVSVILGRPRSGEAAQNARHSSVDVDHVRALLSSFGADPVAMRGGGILVLFSGRGAATDQARHAARCALLLGHALPWLCVTVATGRAETAGRMPVGAAIDRAAELLAQHDDAELRVSVDTLTAGLLDSNFEIHRAANTTLLAGHSPNREADKLLMGRSTPFVGRDKELALLRLTVSECIEESVARAVLITGPPGQGKSRLRSEFVASARERSAVRVFMARADPMGAGSPFLLVRQLVRQAIGLGEGGLATEQWEKLRGYVERVCDRTDAPRIADFLGELVGVRGSERAGPELRAARNDPQIMAVWLRRSFGDWLAGECAATPMLLVLEDLHWGDLPSVTYLGDSLRALSTQPLMVLGLARPEVHQAFVKLWPGTEKQEIALGRLPPRAAERLVRTVLGDKVAALAIRRIIDRADGNPFYLEELMRRFAEGDRESLPETVLALVQSRMERLDGEARRVVQAGSIFGEMFWRGGVAAVLGSTLRDADLRERLQNLVEREVLTHASESRFADEVAYAFRHGLLREAAYAMLTEPNRASGHERAGDWLERAGDKDALTLAEHFERGGATTRAVPWFVSAAQAAADGGNPAAAIALGQRAIACGAQGAERARACLVQAQALAMIGDWSECVVAARCAMELLDPGSTLWFLAVAAVITSGSFLCSADLTASGLQAYRSAPVQPEPSGPYGLATYCTVQGLTTIGETEAAHRLLERVDMVAHPNADADPMFVVWLSSARGRLRMLSGDLGGALRCLQEARILADRTGAAFGRAMADYYFVMTLGETGHVERTARAAHELQTFCAAAGMEMCVDWATLSLSLVRVAAADASQAVAPLRALLNRADKLLVTSARAALAQALLACGDVRGAEQQSMIALAGSDLPSGTCSALRCRALVELRLARPESALAFAVQGLEMAAGGSNPQTLSLLRLTRAEALHMLGRSDEAQVAIRQARAHLLGVAASLDDSELRAAYLTDVRAHARTLMLADEWLRGEAL